MTKKSYAKQFPRVALWAGGLVFWLGFAGAWAAQTTLIGDFETSGTPQAVSPFGFGTGQGAILTGGTAGDPVYGDVPTASEGSCVYGLTWSDAGGNATVEVGCGFAVPPGYDLTGNSRLLLDVYVPAGTTTTVALGIWFSDVSVWKPEGGAVGSNDQWVTMAVDVSDLTGEDLGGLNLAFKNVPETGGTLFFDNLRMESEVVLPTTLVGDFETSGTPQTISPFGLTSGQGAILTGGTTGDPVYGDVPAATEGTSVYGLTWSDAGGDGTVELGCGFAVPPGYTLTGYNRVLLDVYIPSGTSSDIALGIWFSDVSAWKPEGSGAGSNDQWVTLAVDISDLTGEGLGGFNLAFKNVPETSGTIFLDNLRFESETPEPEAAHVWVKPAVQGGDDANDGLTPATAKATINGGLAALQEAGDQVWVMAGTYTEEVDLMADDLVYGGFDGSETSLDERDIVANETIISGNPADEDLVRFGDQEDGATQARLDGFTVTGVTKDLAVAVAFESENNDSTTVLANCKIVDNEGPGYKGKGILGGGINTEPVQVIGCTLLRNVNTNEGGSAAFVSWGSKVDFIDCVFQDNESNGAHGGGAVRVLAGGGATAITMTRCTFQGNSCHVANPGGGAVYLESGTSAEFTECQFTGNYSTLYAGALALDGAVATLTRCLIENNSSDQEGGFARVGGTTAGLELSNCILANNSGTRGGCLTLDNPDQVRIVNCTIVGNTSHGWQGVAAGAIGGASLLKLNLLNSIVAYNQAAGLSDDGDTTFSAGQIDSNLFMENVSGPAVYGPAATGLTVDQINNELGVTTNIAGTADPFYDRAAGDYRLVATAQAIDEGRNSVAPANDYAGNTRPNGTACDIGAYEYYWINAAQGYWSTYY